MTLFNFLGRSVFRIAINMESVVIFSSVLNLSCLVNKEWTMYCCEQ